MGANGKAINIVLLGRTGNGKSATGNSILGRKAFVSKVSSSSVTANCKLDSCVTKDGRTLNVIDTPGLFDTGAEPSYIAEEIVRCIQLAKDGLHAVLYVASINNRFTAEEAKVIDVLQALFGPKIVDYMVVVFTGGDTLERDDITLEEYLQDSPKELKDLLRRCHSRKVIFNNTPQNRKKEEQRTIFLKEIDNIITKNGGQPYSNEIFQQFKKISAIGSDQKKEAELYKKEAERYKRAAETAAETYRKQVEELAELHKRTVKMLEEKIKSLYDTMWISTAATTAVTIGAAVGRRFCTIS